MSTLISAIETQARRHLRETTASDWTSAELVDITIKGIQDLWRPVVDLRQEYYLTLDTTHVTLPASTSTLAGVPTDTYKIYLIEPRDVSSDSSNKNLIFSPLDYNHLKFQTARSRDAIDPQGDILYYALRGPGGPTGAPSVDVAPQVTSEVLLSFVYVPTLPPLASTDIIPIPGEADNALIAWTVAFARAKEREDRSPDPSWIAIYATEKSNLLNSLGIRQLQEPIIVDGVFDAYL